MNDIDFNMFNMNMTKDDLIHKISSYYIIIFDDIDIMCAYTVKRMNNTQLQHYEIKL